MKRKVSDVANWTFILQSKHIMSSKKILHLSVKLLVLLRSQHQVRVLMVLAVKYLDGNPPLWISHTFVSVSTTSCRLQSLVNIIRARGEYHRTAAQVKNDESFEGFFLPLTWGASRETGCWIQVYPLLGEDRVKDSQILLQKCRTKKIECGYYCVAWGVEIILFKTT